MATVYRARDKRLGREVAVKVIHHHLRENQEVAARFWCEERAVAKVKHPSFVEVYDVYDTDESERYLSPQEAGAVAPRSANCSPSTAFCPPRWRGRGGRSGLGARRACGLGGVHRSVKPENVLLDLPTEAQSSCAESSALVPRVKITDFAG